MSVTVLIVACYAGACLLLLGLLAKVNEWRNRRRWRRRRNRRPGYVDFGNRPAGDERPKVEGPQW